jgi:hypothetical protein
MTTRTRRSRAHKTTPSHGIVVEGAERYIWVFPDGDRLVLAIPGLRDLKFSIDEARAVGEMLIQAADETLQQHMTRAQGGDNDASSEESSTQR